MTSRDYCMVPHRSTTFGVPSGHYLTGGAAKLILSYGAIEIRS
jgi:hypothetical protein